MCPKINLHIHTLQSRCAQREMTVNNIIMKAQAAGLEVIGLSDHLHEKNRDFNEMILTTRRCLTQIETSITVLVGCEAQMVSPEKVTIDQSVAVQLDYVSISADHYHVPEVENPRKKTPPAYADHYLKMLEGALDTGFCSMISHPFVFSKVEEMDVRQALAAYDKKALTSILKKAADRNVAFEFNPKHAATFPGFYTELVSTFHDLGVKFTIGTDAHSLSDIGYVISDDLIKALGINEDDFTVPIKTCNRIR
ncbi:MAG: PHP domain-containing protein [Phycisphaerae bacterium]